jgi:hypothetical protein
MSAAEAGADPADRREAPGPALLEKVQTVVAKVGRLQRDFVGAQAAAHQAQVREALTRTELTVALNASLLARAELEGRLRDQARAAHARLARGRLRRHNRLSQALDRALARLGSIGQALVIARSGVWRGAGRPLHDLRHMAAYARRGPNPAVAPSALFDQAWYLAANPDVARGRISPLAHYLVAGSREGRSPAPLLDEAFYRRENAADIAATSVSALEHYARVGGARARDPHPVFDVGHYLAQGPVLADGEDPLSHYLREGWRQSLSPHPLFDLSWYAEQAGPGQSLLHYLTTGWRSGMSPHPLFDPAWYLAQYPELTGIEPLTHFVAVGGFEGRSPSPWFDTPHYVAERGEARAPDVNPLVDYLRGGAWTVAEARPGFPTAAYLVSRPDLVRAGLTPLEHWARRGGG